MKPILFLLLAFLGIVSCNELKSSNNAQKDVPFEEAKRYFVKNTVEKVNGALILNSLEDFEKYFGAAAVMGKDGMPTKIDFSKEFVIALIEDEVEKSVDLKAISLIKSNDLLVLKVDKKVGDDLSFTIRPSLVLIVDKKYEAPSVSTQIN